MSDSCKYEITVNGLTVKISEQNYNVLVSKFAEWMNQNGRGSFTEIHCQDGSKIMTVPFEAFCAGYVKCALEHKLVDTQFK